MAALGNRHIDILFLDIEGAEFGVLQALPLQQVHIDILNIEVSMPSQADRHKKIELMEALLSPYGYHRLNTPFYVDIAMTKLNKQH